MDISQMSDDEIKAELAKRARKPKIHPVKQSWAASPVGLWEVTTEGDVEGRSTKRLGFFRGHVADIALHLNGKQYYKLEFCRVKENPIIDVVGGNKKGEVDASLEIESGTWDLGSDDRAASIEAWLNTEKAHGPFTVETSRYYACIKIVRK